MAGVNLSRQHIDEILTGGDILHIHENVIVGKGVRQGVVHPRGRPLIVRPPVGNEDLAATHRGQVTRIAAPRKGWFHSDRTP